MTYYINDARLADMIQCLFCDILEDSCARPKSFEESMHLLAVLKRRGLEKRLEASAELERLRAELAAKQPAEAGAAQQGPSDEEIPVDVLREVCVNRGHCDDAFCSSGKQIEALAEALRALDGVP